MTSSHSFRLRILRSGSSGNAIFLEAAGTRLIIDVGLPAEVVARELESIPGASPITAILLTHEHDDHAKGAGAPGSRERAPAPLAWSSCSWVSRIAVIGEAPGMLSSSRATTSAGSPTSMMRRVPAASRKMALPLLPLRKMRRRKEWDEVIRLKGVYLVSLVSLVFLVYLHLWPRLAVA